jgi:hypothetical protein
MLKQITKFSEKKKNGLAKRSMFIPIATRNEISASQACVIIWIFLFFSEKIIAISDDNPANKFAFELAIDSVSQDLTF